MVKIDKELTKDSMPQYATKNGIETRSQNFHRLGQARVTIGRHVKP